MRLKGIEEKINAGMSQRQIAIKCGMKPEQLWRYVNDKVDPTYYTLKRIATILGLSIDELINGRKKGGR